MVLTVALAQYLLNIMTSFNIPDTKKSRYTKLMNMYKNGTDAEKKAAGLKLKNLFVNLPKV